MCYNKATNERTKQKMFVSFKTKRGKTDGIIKGSRHGTAGSRRDAAQEIIERRVRKAMIPSHSEVTK